MFVINIMLHIFDPLTLKVIVAVDAYNINLDNLTFDNEAILKIHITVIKVFFSRFMRVDFLVCKH